MAFSSGYWPRRIRSGVEAKETRKASRLRRLAEDASGTFATRLVTMTFGLGTGIITARALGPEGRGIFSLAALFPATVVTLSKLGQGVASVYFIRREREDPGRIASNDLALAVIVGTVLVCISALASPALLGSVLRGVPFWALAVMLPMIPVLLTESYLYGVLQATDRFRVYNTRLLAEAVLTLTGMALVLLWWKAGLRGALGVVVAIRITMATWVVVTIHRTSPLRWGFDTGLFRRMLRYGLKSHMQIVASHFHFKADIYLLAYFLDPARVAFYVIAARLAEHILYVPQSLGLALFPRLAGSGEDRAHEMTAAACRQTVAVTGLLAVFVTFVGPALIVAWYGREFAPAARPLGYIAVGIVMMSLYVLLSRNFTSRDKQRINIIAAYLALGGNLALNCVLIPKYGIVGAAIATMVSYSVSALLLLGFFLHDSGLRLRDVILVNRSDLAMWGRLASELRGSMRPAKA